MRATPIATSSALFDTKYGYTISAMHKEAQSDGTEHEAEQQR